MDNDYLDDCPDCMELPTAFPSSCLGPIVSALGGKVDDPKCLLHCGITLLAWGANLYIGEDGHPLLKGKLAASRGGNADFKAARAELKKVQKATETRAATAAGDLAAFNWKIILQAVLMMLQQLLSQQK